MKKLKSSRTWSIDYSGFISHEWFGGHTKHKYLHTSWTNIDIVIVLLESILSNKTITSIIFMTAILQSIIRKSRSIRIFKPGARRGRHAGFLKLLLCECWRVCVCPPPGY